MAELEDVPIEFRGDIVYNIQELLQPFVAVLQASTIAIQESTIAIQASAIATQESAAAIQISTTALQASAVTIQASASAIESIAESASHDNAEYIGRIDILHEMIHDGLRYANSYSISRDIGEHADIALSIPESLEMEIHLTFSYSSSGIATILLYRDVTVSNGVSFPLHNLNHLSPNTASVIAVTAPTVTGLGTLIKQIDIGTDGEKKSQFGGDGISRYEYICERGVDYLIRGTSGGATKIINLAPDFYELPTS